MKELLHDEFQKLKDLYLGGSFTERKVLYYKLKQIKDEVEVHSVKVNNNTQISRHNFKAFNQWVSLTFPDMAEYLKEDKVPSIFDEDEFPRFKKIKIKPSDLVGNNIGIIKKIEVWGKQQKIKQNYQKVEEISFEGDVLTFYLSNNAFLQVWHPELLYDSDYCLQIKRSPKIVLAISSKETLEFVLEDSSNKLEIRSNKKESEFFDCSSFFTPALEIIK